MLVVPIAFTSDHNFNAVCLSVLFPSIGVIRVLAVAVAVAVSVPAVVQAVAARPTENSPGGAACGGRFTAAPSAHRSSAAGKARRASGV